MPWMASRKAEDSKEVRRPLTSRKDTLSECRMVIEKFKIPHLRTQLKFYSENRERQRHYRGAAAAVRPFGTFDCECARCAVTWCSGRRRGNAAIRRAHRRSPNCREGLGGYETNFRE